MNNQTQFRFADATDIGALETIRKQLMDGNAMLAEGKKLADSAKESLTSFLLRERKYDIEKQGNGESVTLIAGGQTILEIVTATQARLNAKLLAAAHPEIVAQFTGMDVTTFRASKTYLPALPTPKVTAVRVPIKLTVNA